MERFKKPTAISFKKGINNKVLQLIKQVDLDFAKRKEFMLFIKMEILRVLSLFLFLNFIQKLLPGSKIFVPKKPEKTTIRLKSIGEIVTITTTWFP